MLFASRKKQKTQRNMTKQLKPMRLRCKYRCREPRNAWKLAPRRPSDRTTIYTRTASQLRLASPARRARTAHTKRKRRRNEADLPVTGGRTSQTSSPKPPIYVEDITGICTCKHTRKCICICVTYQCFSKSCPAFPHL